MGFAAIGENAVIMKLMGTAEAFEQGLKEAATEAGELLVRTEQQGMDGAGSPSAAGGYPGVKSGTLRAGIQFTATRNALYFRSTGVSIRGKRGRKGAPLFMFMEDGTGKMGARPGMRLAVEQAEGEVDQILEDKPFKRLK
jgi:hypothetical protein